MTRGRVTTQGRRRRVWARLSFWMGIGFGVALTAVVCQLPYVDWSSAAPPIDARPLTIRHDAKGNGQFFAPRSGRRHHRGIDLVAVLNSPVHAIRSGIVVQVGLHRGLGRFVELEHRHHLHSLYAHLNDVRVDPGAHIRQGMIIGTVGKTGNARHPWITPHLHLEVFKDGEPLDPQTVGLQVVDPTTPLIARDRQPSEPSESDDASGGE